MVEIHIWTAAVDAPLDQRWSALLDADERARAARFKFERDRQHFIAAHALKRTMLGAICDQDPAAWSFVTDASGKPSVAGGTGPHFNISHSHGRVACAVSHGVAVGVDVEPIGRVVTPDLIRAALSPPEADWLARQRPADQSTAFFRLWTLKEAFIKATGRGLAQSLQHFAIALDPIRVTFLDPSRGPPQDWFFSQEIMADAHVLSCAAGVQTAEVELRQFDFHLVKA